MTMLVSRVSFGDDRFYHGQPELHRDKEVAVVVPRGMVQQGSNQILRDQNAMPTPALTKRRSGEYDFQASLTLSKQ